MTDHGVYFSIIEIGFIALFLIVIIGLGAILVMLTLLTESVRGLTTRIQIVTNDLTRVSNAIARVTDIVGSCLIRRKGEDNGDE